MTRKWMVTYEGNWELNVVAICFWKVPSYQLQIISYAINFLTLDENERVLRSKKYVILKK